MKIIGYFFAKDIFQQKEIVIAFCWDATDSNNPIWSQAFSEDKGKTWEWNWYMYMSKVGEKRLSVLETFRMIHISQLD